MLQPLDERLRRALDLPSSPIGLIALDIDGTLLSACGSVADALVELLRGLAARRWLLLFATGRAYCYAKSVLAELELPSYLLAAHNGAHLLASPSAKTLYHLEVSAEIAQKATALVARRLGGTLYYLSHVQESDIEADYIVHNPDEFDAAELDYLRCRAAAYGEELKKSSSLPYEGLAALKWLTSADNPALYDVAEELTAALGCHAPVIADPFSAGRAVLQIVHPSADKGKAVEQLRRWYPGLPAIAAGNDHNDLPLLAAADWKIAIEGSPAPLLEAADTLAGAGDDTLAAALSSAMKRLENGL